MRSGGGLLCGAAHRARPKPFGAAVRCGGGLLFGAAHGARPKPLARFYGAVQTAGRRKMEWTYEMRREMWVPPCPLHPIGHDVTVSVARVCAAACGVVHALRACSNSRRLTCNFSLLAVQARGETKRAPLRSKTVRKRVRSHPSVPPFLSHISLHTSIVVVDFVFQIWSAMLEFAVQCLLSVPVVLRHAPAFCSPPSPTCTAVLASVAVACSRAGPKP